MGYRKTAESSEAESEEQRPLVYLSTSTNRILPKARKSIIAGKKKLKARQ
jgi:hypothetical protein